MRWVLCGILLAALVLAKKKKHKRTNMPTLYPVTDAPARPPVFQHTADEYAYYAKIYQERADFLYKFFPHSGPSFYNAQTDQALANKFYQLAKEEEE